MEERDLWRAVMDHPDEDAPRLVYADWLLDRGDPRGEFIVLQCRLEALADHDPARAAIARRADELLEAHHSEWYPDAGGAALAYRRGFPWAATADIADDPLALLERVPLQELTLTSRSTRDRLVLAHRIACDPRLARLSRLVLEVDWGEQGIALLMAGAHWGRLRELAIHGSDCRTATLHALAEASFTGLRRLELDGRGMGVLDDGDVRDLAAPAFGRLRSLVLRDIGLRDAAAHTLAGSRYLTELVELDLTTSERDGVHDNRVEAPGARALAYSRNVRELRRLVLDRNRIGSLGFAVLMSSPAFAALRELSLRHNDIDDAGMGILADGPGTPRLERLDLASNTAITADGAAMLAGSGRLRGLRALDLRGCWVGTRGTRALAGCPHARNLRELDLSWCGIGDEGAFAIAQSPALLGLERLWADGNGIQGQARAALEARFGGRVALDG